jgi:hypothetical protein
MPRNSSGNYTLPAGNPVVAGTIIDVDWANPTMQDIAVQLNNVLTRDGLLGPISPLLAVDGTVGLPGLSFAANPTTGLYNSATGAGFAYLGVLFWFANASGVRIAKPLILGNPTAPGTPLADGDLNVEGKIYINGVEFNIYSLLSSPPPIGDVVPNTGAFTTLKAGGADVVTLTAVQTLLNKTLTTPVLSNPSYSGTTANGGTVTTIDINGGTIDGTVIGSTTPAAGSFTTLSASGVLGVIGEAAASGYKINASAVLTPVSGTQATQFVTTSTLQWACGSGGYSFNNNANSAVLMGITNAGAVTIPGSLSAGATTITGPAANGAGNNGLLVDNNGVLFATRRDGGGGGDLQVGTPHSHNLMLMAGGNTAVRIGVDGAVTIPGSLSITGTSLGFGTGAGGTVTQATSKSTAVTLNKACGQITMNNALLAASDTVSFYVFSNKLAVADVVIVTGCNDGAVNPANYFVYAASIVSGDRCLVSVKNITAGNLSEAVVLNFAILKGATS